MRRKKCYRVHPWLATSGRYAYGSRSVRVAKVIINITLFFRRNASLVAKLVVLRVQNEIRRPTRTTDVPLRIRKRPCPAAGAVAPAIELNPPGTRTRKRCLQPSDIRLKHVHVDDVP